MDRAGIVQWCSHHHGNVLCHICGIALSTNESSSMRSPLEEQGAIMLLGHALACANSEAQLSAFTACSQSAQRITNQVAGGKPSRQARSDDIQRRWTGIVFCKLMLRIEN